MNLRSIFINNPISELHLHLGGCLTPLALKSLFNKHPLQNALELAPSRHLQLFLKHIPNLKRLNLPQLTELEIRHNFFTFTSFEGFLIKYLFCGYFIKDLSDFDLGLSCLADYISREGLDYIEVTVSLPEYLAQGLSLIDIQRRLRNFSLESKAEIHWLVDLVRNTGPDATYKLLNELMRVNENCFCGLTLGGAEHLFPPEQFKATFELARAAGLRTSIHSGEALGAESVWQAIKILKPDRIGHGIRAIEDPSLVSYLVETQIPLEVCIKSNLLTGVVQDLEAHPIKCLFDKGVNLTLNSDDPSFFDTGLLNEFKLAKKLGLTEDNLTKIAANNYRCGFRSKRV